MPPIPRVALSRLLRRVQEPATIEPGRSYKQITVRLFHRGAVLRGEIEASRIRTQKQWIARAGQVILSRIDARNGAIAIVPASLDEAVVTNDFWLFDVDAARIEPGFLDAYFGTEGFRKACQRASEGTTNRVRIQPEKFEAIEVPLPPLPEQQRIVARIDEVAVRSSEAKRLHSEAKGQRAALWTAGARSAVLALGAGKRPLSELVTVLGGGTPSKDDPSLWTGDIPWVSPKDMKTREIWDAHDHISGAALRISAVKSIAPGAVLIVVRGMILAHTVPAAVLRVAAAINQDMKALVPLNTLSPEYLCLAVWALNGHLLSLVERSSHDTRKLETRQLLAFEIPVPPREDQDRVVQSMNELRARTDSVEAHHQQISKEVEALVPAVLNRVFAGEV